jgi:threonine aldolase
MAKKPNGHGWPLEYDRQLIELARATNSLEVLAAQIKRSPAAVLKRARRLGISINSQTSGKSEPSDRLKAARASARAHKLKVKK